MYDFIRITDDGVVELVPTDEEKGGNSKHEKDVHNDEEQIHVDNDEYYTDEEDDYEDEEEEYVVDIKQI